MIYIRPLQQLPSGFAGSNRWSLIALFAICLSSAAAHSEGRKQAMQAHGATLFADKGCSHCHGAAGFGGSDSGPDLSRVRKELRAPEIAQQIHDGGNNMPPFGDTLSDDEIAALVEYLRLKRKPPPGFHPRASTQPTVPAPAGQNKPDPD